MARAIDKRIMLDLIIEAKNTDPETGPFSEWLAEYLVDHLPTLTPPNETPPCYQPDGDGCAYQCYDGQDEPIDKCKEYPLCYSDKQRQPTLTPPNEWVSVEDDVPDPGVRVLAANGNFVGEAYMANNGAWMRHDGFPWEVDAWMPMPDRRPPEEEKL